MCAVSSTFRYCKKNIYSGVTILLFQKYSKNKKSYAQYDVTECSSNRFVKTHGFVSCLFSSIKYLMLHMKHVFLSIANISGTSTSGGGFTRCSSSLSSGQQYVTDFLNALLTSSLQAIYLLAINYATNEDVDFQRIDCRPDLLYTCNITNNKILKLDNTNTIYYKRGGEFIFRKDDRCYHSTSIKSIFDTKVSNKRKR